MGLLLNGPVGEPDMDVFTDRCIRFFWLWSLVEEGVAAVAVARGTGIVVNCPERNDSGSVGMYDMGPQVAEESGKSAL